MVEGFWLVQFEGVQGGGGGVAIFTKGKVFGGDSGFTYTGEYTILQGTEMHATIEVRNFVPSIPNVLGVHGDFRLDVRGRVEPEVIRAKGSPIGAANVGIGIKLTKVADLP